MRFIRLLSGKLTWPVWHKKAHDALVYQDAIFPYDFEDPSPICSCFPEMVMSAVNSPRVGFLYWLCQTRRPDARWRIRIRLDVRNLSLAVKDPVEVLRKSFVLIVEARFPSWVRSIHSRRIRTPGARAWMLSCSPKLSGISPQ